MQAAWLVSDGTFAVAVTQWKEIGWNLNTANMRVKGGKAKVAKGERKGGTKVKHTTCSSFGLTFQ